MFRKYRILIVIYGLGLLVGIREVLISRHREPFGWFTPRGRELLGILEEVNPGEPDVDFLQGMQAFAAGDEQGFFHDMDLALDANIKHNELFLQTYAQGLVDAGADWREVSAAVNRWRRNFPFSRETLIIYLPPGPQYDASLMQRALNQIPWVADSQVLLPGSISSDERGQVSLMFRRGYVVDMEDAVAAIGFATTTR